LELVIRHGELVVEIGEAARDALERAAGPGERGRAVAAAKRAREWESAADDVVSQVRSTAARGDEAAWQLDLVEGADDVADNLEEAAFYLTLLVPGRPSQPVADQARRMCALVVSSARRYLRALHLAGEVQRGGPREEMDAFLEAVHAVVAFERDADDAQRDVHTAIVAERPEAAELFVLLSAVGGLEEAADALMHSAQRLREQVLGTVVREAAPPRRPGPPTAQPRRAVPSGGDLFVIGDGERPIPDVDTLGAKAHGLARMAAVGLRVPEAVVITTGASSRLLAGRGDHVLGELLEQAAGALEAQTGRRLGSRRRPLLVSVRSGAPVSMPGMLETVLDVGLSDLTVRAVVAQTGNPRLAWDCFRRLVESFATVVHGCPLEPFEQAVQERLTEAAADRPLDLEARRLEELTRSHLDRFRELTGAAFPDDPLVQLEQAVDAVLRSWEAPKAQTYRRETGVPDDLCTAVIVQRMVFGNAGGRSGSGVGFTRDPALGERGLYLDFLLDAQGEDIVSGRHRAHGAEQLAALAPELYEAIEHVCPLLEREFGDAQEFELTVEDGQLYLLQARTAKRTPWAALRIAVDQVAEGLISREAALARLDDLDIESIRRVRVGSADDLAALCRAVPASVGLAQEGLPPVLARPDTATADIAAMIVSAGILTAQGGRTSHAAVVARELGKPCLVGCSELAVDLEARTATLGSTTVAEGDVLTLDAESGLVFRGELELVEERPTAELKAIAAWRSALSGRREEVTHAER
jgi:pyruvate,orthophosphate dikinase